MKYQNALLFVLSSFLQVVYIFMFRFFCVHLGTISVVTDRRGVAAGGEHIQ